MKHLTITYNGVTLWDAPVVALDWQDSASGVRVEGRIKAKPAGSGTVGGGLLDILSKASKAKTAQVADEKREAYEVEIVESEPAEGP